MPITKSAEKAMRGSLRKKAINDRKKRAVKEEIKKILKVAKTDKGSVAKMLPTAFQAIDKAAKSGVIKKNTAARRKSRLARLTK